RLDLADRGKRVLKAPDREATLRHKRTLLVDDDGIEAFRRKQCALVAALALRNLKLDRATGIAAGGDAERQLANRLEIVADVHVAVPQAGNERLARAVYDARPSRKLRQRLAHANDLPVRCDDVLAGQKPLIVGVVDLDVLEQHGTARRGRQELLRR